MQNYSWYTDKPIKKSSDNIHQILAFGSIKDIKNIKRTLGKNTLVNLFLQKPKNVYSPSSFNFITKFILHIKNIDEQKYLKSTPRHTR